MNHLLFWGWNNVRGGRKRYSYKTQRDGRKYIEERPEVLTKGHFEMDFIVSKQSTYSLLVVVDRLIKKNIHTKASKQKTPQVNGSAFRYLR